MQKKNVNSQLYRDNIPVQNSFKGGSGATAGAFGGATDDASDPKLWWYFTTEKMFVHKHYAAPHTRTSKHLKGANCAEGELHSNQL